MTARPLYTIGYEKTLLKDVIATLASAGVSTLLDVRDRPISRRPGFSKRQLAAAVEEAGNMLFPPSSARHTAGRPVGWPAPGMGPLLGHRR